MRDLAGREIKVPADQVATRQVSPVSLMPPGLTASLRRDEFVDLIRFLSELGKEGDYKVPRQRYVRRWRTAEAGGAVGELLRRSGVNAAMLNHERISWRPIYSEVAGALPLDGLGISKGFETQLSLVRFQVEVSVAGEFGLRFKDTTGLQVWSGGRAIELNDREATVSSELGRRDFTVVIDRAVRRSPLQIELLDITGKVAPVGGP